MSRLLLLLLAATIGCSAPLTVSREPSAATAEPAPGTTEPCRSEDEVRATIKRFVAAFNSGSRERAESAVSRYAQWYSATLRSGHEVAYGQTGIVDHVVQRYAAGDRLEIARIRVNSLEGTFEGSTNFEVTVGELTRDGAVVQVRGKGALQCRGRGEGIVVLSLGAA